MTIPSAEMVEPDDILAAVEVLTGALGPSVDADWSVPAGALGWSCRRTLDHLPDTLLLYAAHLASRAVRGLPFPRDGDPGPSPRRLLGITVEAAHILAAVGREAAPDARAYHPAGMADPAGFCAMACDEILVHGKDIAVGLGVAFEVPPALAARVVARLFPWAPMDVDPWVALLWANGRTELPGHGQLDADWYWHAAPLEEWDGVPERRQAPPAWS